MTHHGIIFRHHESPDGTWGAFTTDGYAALALELPWRDNRNRISCIPYGRYPVVWDYSRHFKRHTYHIDDVPGRKGIRIHIANRIGELLGCVALGYTTYPLGDGLWAIGRSRDAVTDMERHFSTEPWILEVTWEHPLSYTGETWESVVPNNLLALLEIHRKRTGGVRAESDTISQASDQPHC